MELDNYSFLDAMLFAGVEILQIITSFEIPMAFELQKTS